MQIKKEVLKKKANKIHIFDGQIFFILKNVKKKNNISHLNSLDLDLVQLKINLKTKTFFFNGYIYTNIKNYLGKVNC